MHALLADTLRDFPPPSFLVRDDASSADLLLYTSGKCGEYVGLPGNQCLQEKRDCFIDEHAIFSMTLSLSVTHHHKESII